MTDAECPSFLQWALPRLGRRWAGYRKVRGLTARRIARRLRPPGIEDLAGYRVRQAFPTLTLGIVATDCDPVLIERARAGCYRESSLKELPVDLRAAAFERRNDHWCVRPEYRNVDCLRQDLREAMPDGPFDLVLLRNVIATYCAPEVQREVIGSIGSRMRAGAALVLGVHESLPERTPGFAAWPAARGVFRRSVG